MKEDRPKVYLSGGFKSNWQERVVRACESSLILFNPKEHGLEGDPRQYTAWDLFHVKQCDIFFAYMEVSNTSGLGLCLELGYAKALGKTIVLVDEKSKHDHEFAKYFRIAQESADVILDNLDAGISYILTFSAGDNQIQRR